MKPFRSQMCYSRAKLNLSSIMQHLQLLEVFADKLYNELGIESLYDIRTFHKPPSVPDLHDVRHRRSIWISIRTNKYEYSFLSHSVNAWNNLSSHIKLSPPINIFKTRLMLTLFSQFIILLTRLRVSLLRDHKYRHNFLDTRNPFCSCDGKSIESVENYLLRCPNHARYRTVRFENLNSIKENLNFLSDSVNIVTLLYGKKSFDDLTNKRILESTI